MKRTKQTIAAMTILLVTAFFSLSIPAKADIDFWPVLEVSKDSRTVCYPFYTQEGDFTMILNLYANTNSGKDHHIFWPFIKISEGRLERVAPIWYSSAPNDYVFLPFVWQTDRFAVWSIPPAYVNYDEDFSAIFPLYVKNKNSLYIFPNTLIKEEDGNKSAYVFPFYSYKHSYAERETTGHFLNCFYTNNDIESEFVLLPFAGRTITQNPDKENSFVLLPYIHEWSDAQQLSKHIVLPFIATKRSPEENYTWCLNYYTYNSDSESSFNVFPFYGASEEVNHETGTTKESLWLGWPFYARERQYNSERNLVAKNNRFLIFSNRWEEGGKRTFSILGQVVAERVN